MISNYYHLSWVRSLRSFARKTGVLGVLKKSMSRKHKSYEQAFHEALKSSISPGNTVWDIGANVGLYTKYFLDWTGPSGTVVSFEPLPDAINKLSAAISSHQYGNRVILRKVALADKAGQAFFSENPEGEDVTTTAHIKEANEGAGEGIAVTLSTVDDEVSKENTPPPAVVKIDVEGFEEDVLRGGQKVFANSSCRHILVEMHFTRMDERKLGDSASRIVNMLKGWGYKVQWVDPSHLHASR